MDLKDQMLATFVNEKLTFARSQLVVIASILKHSTGFRVLVGWLVGGWLLADGC